MCAYYYSTDFSDANPELTKKGHLKNHYISCVLMLWFALWVLTPAGSNPAESQALGHQPWVSDPTCEEVGFDKLAGVEDSGLTVGYNFTLEALHRDMQESLSKRPLFAGQ